MNDIYDGALTYEVPRDPAYAEWLDLENTCAAWTPAEMRDAAQLCLRLATIQRKHSVIGASLIADLLTFDMSVPEDYRSLLGGVLSGNERACDQMADSAAHNRNSAELNTRCAGALLWLAEQREAGTS